MRGIIQIYNIVSTYVIIGILDDSPAKSILNDSYFSRITRFNGVCRFINLSAIQATISFFTRNNFA